MIPNNDQIQSAYRLVASLTFDTDGAEDTHCMAEDVLNWVLTGEVSSRLADLDWDINDRYDAKPFGQP